jgi:hypothetical protein
MSEMLRADLAGGEQQLLKPRVYNIVVSMLITATFENGLEEAAVHARMLKYIVYKLSSRTSKDIDLGISYKAMWNDFDQASKTLARMAFNGDWVADLSRPGWQQALKDYLLYQVRLRRVSTKASRTTRTGDFAPCSSTSGS